MFSKLCRGFFLKVIFKQIGNVPYAVKLLFDRFCHRVMAMAEIGNGDTLNKIQIRFSVFILCDCPFRFFDIDRPAAVGLK